MIREHQSGEAAGKPDWLNSTVVGASVTSALGDLAYETANVILPGFLAVLGMPAAVLGTIEGVADAVSSFTKLGAGYVADKLGYRKALVVAGYGLTALMQVCFALAGGWILVLLGRVIGWLGRGIRGPLRDAILAEAITPETRGKAFGLHRAADTVGAVLGPLLAVALLSWTRRFWPQHPVSAFRLVFWLTLIPGTLSVVSFALLVTDNRTELNSGLRFWAALHSLPRDFRRYLTAVGAFGIGDFAHTLLILAATQMLTPEMGLVRAAQVAGLLYVGRNIVQAAASFPIGALADHFGHRRLLVIGYLMGTATALLTAIDFAISSRRHLPLLAAIFALAGLYIAIEEALEAAQAASYVPDQVRSVGYGALGTVNGIGDFVSSATVGFLWTAVTPVLGFGVAAGLMAAGTIAMARLPDRPA
jgi:MFS family permease